MYDFSRRRIFKPDPNQASTRKVKTPKSPEEQDEQSAAGTMPDPESDDDTLKNAQDEGLYSGYDEEHQGELDLDRELDKANKPQNK